MNDLEISELVNRLSRPHRSGGVVIERAAIQAAGADYPAVIDWIMAHEGEPESIEVVTKKSGGLHGSRINAGATPGARPPQRFVLPAGALN
jgi:hypothetical protein